MEKASISRKAPYQQVKEAVYQKYILNGAKPGTRLPSDRALATEFGVNVATVAKGLSALSLEGIVSRKVGSGTYVQSVRSGQKTGGIYLGAPVTSYAQPEMAVFAKLDQLLQQTLYSRGEEFFHYSDSRIREYWKIPHPALQSDARDGKLSDLIVIRANPSNYQWLEQLAVNIIGFEVDYGSGVVMLDLESFSRQSVEYLARNDCRDIGLITRVPPKKSERTPGRLSLHEAFHQTVISEGAQTHSDWIKTDDFDNTLTDAEPMDSELFGYTAFQSVWNAPKRPQGIVVHSDIVGLGVVRAAKDLRVNLDNDVKVIFSANLGSDWSPLDNHTRMAFPLKDISNALIALIGNREKKRSLIKPVLVQPQ